MKSTIMPLAVVLLLASPYGNAQATSTGEHDESQQTPPGTEAGSPWPVPSPSPTMAIPHPGTEDTRPVPFERWERRGPSTIRLIYWSGVAPCDVLDHVQVRTTAHKVILRILVGRDPAVPPDTACIQITQLRAVDVALPEPLRDRAVVDGAKAKHPR